MKKLLFFLFLLAAPLVLAQDGSIEFKGGKGKKFSLDFNIKGVTDPDPVDNRAIPIFMIVMGGGLILVRWLNAATGTFREQGNILDWKTEGGDRFWVQLLAEYATAGLAIAAGIGLMGQNGWGYKLALVALGALVYASLNSLAWSFAEKSRIPYSIPMLLGLAGSLVSIILLVS